MSETKNVMDTLVGAITSRPPEGEVVKGKVIGLEKGRVYVDLSPYGTGLIFGREFQNARDIIRNISIGEEIDSTVIEHEGHEGYTELSLKEARQAIIWGEIEEVLKAGDTLNIPVTEANKGGLILDWKGVQGFLPASQLNSDHYPRVADGDKQRILEELNKLVGEIIEVNILTAIPTENKLIFTEKGNTSGGNRSGSKSNIKLPADATEFKVGQILDGEVTGMVDFGIFVKIAESVEGLVHISEIDWSLVEDPRALYKIGDTVKIQIIEIKDGKISLSIKALKENPWTDAANRYNKDDEVEGVVIKYNKHGALASIEEGVAGLVHVSEFESEAALRDTLSLGGRYKFTITLFDPKEQRMALSHKA